MYNFKELKRHLQSTMSEENFRFLSLFYTDLLSYYPHLTGQ